MSTRELACTSRGNVVIELLLQQTATIAARAGTVCDPQYTSVSRTLATSAVFFAALSLNRLRLTAGYQANNH